MENEQLYEQIEKYLMDEMSEQERSIFESEIQKNDALKQEVQIHQELANAVSDPEIHQLRETLKKVDSNWKMETVAETGTKTSKIDEIPSKNKVRNLNFRRFTAIAASLLLFVLLRQFIPMMNAPNSTQLFSENYEPYRMVLTERSNIELQNDNDLKINEAVNLYQSKQYPKAALAFEELHSNNPSNEAFQLYAAISNISSQQSEKAIQQLEKLIKNAGPLYIQQTRWYLAMAYLQADRQEKAKTVFDEIKEGDWKFKEKRLID